MRASSVPRANRSASISESQNIEARPVWKPMHLQPVSPEMSRPRRRGLGGTLREGLCLPSGSAMSDAELRHVTTSIANVPRLAHPPLKTLTMTERMIRV